MTEAPRFVEFLESHRPPLEAGKYRIAVAQKFSLTPHAAEEALETLAGQSYDFTVAGPQLSLSPQEIAAVFPPAGSLGDHSNVFPHVALHRSTLPWERSADAHPDNQERDWTQAPTPWLALLVYDEDDIGTGAIRLAAPAAGKDALTVATLDALDAGYPLAHDAAQGDTVVSAVAVRTAELEAFLPTAMECRLLCHVRRNILFSVPWEPGREPTPANLLGKFPADLGLIDDGTIVEPALDREDGQRCWRLRDGKRERSFLLWENASGVTLQVTDEDAAEYAFVIGIRLSRAGKTTTVHLISLEGRFAKGHLTPSV